MLRGGDLAASGAAVAMSGIWYETPSLRKPGEVSWLVPCQDQPPHQQHRDTGSPQLLREERRGRTGPLAEHLFCARHRAKWLT